MPSAVPEWKQYRRALAFVRPLAWQLAGVTAVGVVATSLSLAQPYFSKLLIDDALLSRNPRALVWIAAAMALATIAGFAANIASSYHYIQIAARILFEMRMAIYRRLLQCSPRFWAQARLGDVVSRMNNDVAEVQRIATDSLLAACTNLVFLAGAAVIMLWVSPAVFVISLASLPFGLWAMRRHQERLSDQSRQVRERAADIGSFLIETLTGYRLVATSNAQTSEAQRFAKHNEGFVSALLSLQWTSFVAGAAPGSILTLSTAAVFLYGGQLVIAGTMTPGSLIALMAYHTRLLGPVQNLMNLWNSMVTGGVSLKRLFEILDAPVDVQDPPHPVRLGQVEGRIEVSDVSFAFGERPILNCASFTVEPGTTCAILGSSGAGKSTLADLLVRFQDPDAGRITLDGHDLRALSLNDLRRHVVLVDQSALVFRGSIGENIQYGSPGASQAQVEQAARAAAIHDYIASLPDGYSTLVGERGLTLSTGERHRLTLARALLRNPAVLILDEPTAALDEATEREIIESLPKALAGHTVIFITHRPSLAAIAGQVVTIEHGKAVMSAQAVS